MAVTVSPSGLVTAVSPGLSTITASHQGVSGAAQVTVSTPPLAAPKAFPSAQGFGAQSLGGRGGVLLEVTNLNDSGPGSLRAAVDAFGPRTVVFRTGGIIKLASPLVLRNPYITIAGQTAPGGGIVVTGVPNVNNSLFQIITHNFVIRYIRARNIASGAPASGQVNFALINGAHDGIIDHCSGSWSLDEGFMVWRYQAPPAPDIANITIQRCIIAEGLAGHSTGMLIGGRFDYGVNPPIEEYLKIRQISVHHNLFVHNYDRNPRATSSGCQLINNVVYNWGSRVGVSEAKNTIDLINNYWKPGPMSQNLIYKHEPKHITMGWVYPPPSIYIAGNIVPPVFNNPSADNWPLIVENVTLALLPLSYRRFTPISEGPVPVDIQTAANAYASVLADVGANKRLDGNGQGVPNYDSVDQRLLTHVMNGTGWSVPVESPEASGGFPVIAPGVPYPDTDHDGMSDAWETAAGLNPTNPGDGNLVGLEGYTNLERFLNGV